MTKWPRRRPRDDEDERGGCTANTLQKQAKHPCFCPPNNRCCPLAVSPLTSAIKADESRWCHPTPAHHDGVDYTDKRAGDDNGNGAPSSAATERTLITVIIG